MANSILGTRSPNGNVGVSGVVDSGELSMLTAGALSGFALTALAGMNVAAGGVAGTQDVAVAKNPAGASDLLVGNGASMSFAIGAAPGTSGQSRTDVLVVWKDTTVLATQNNGYDSVGYSVVPGAAATTGTQQPPSEATIRAAIPNGGSAFYAIVGYVTVPYGAVNAASCTLLSAMAGIEERALPKVSPSRLNTLFADLVFSSATAVNVNNTPQTIPMVLLSSNGMGVSQNGVLIPTGVKTVAASGSVFVGGPPAGARTSLQLAYRTSGGSVSIKTIGQRSLASGISEPYVHVHAPRAVFEVEPGGIVYLTVLSGSASGGTVDTAAQGTTGNFTRLSVQAIG